MINLIHFTMPHVLIVRLLSMKIIFGPITMVPDEYVNGVLKSNLGNIVILNMG